MILFESIFKNHFDTKEISDDSFKKFVEDHIQRTTAKNGGGTFTTMITDTTNAYTSYFGNMSNEDIALAVQQSLTQTNDNIFESFKDTVSQKEGYIRSFYNVDTPIYQEFFPHGVTEYRQSTKANVETLMTRMKAASTAHVGDLGAPFVAIWTAFLTNWPASRNAQLLKIGEVDSTKTMTSDTRDALETQVLKNLFFVGFTFPGNVTECMDFFKQDIIRYDVSSDSDGKGRILGVVRDAITTQFLADAAIEVLNTNVPVAKSKIDGTFKTQRMDIGSKQVRITYPGKTEKVINVNVADAGDTTLNVDL